MFDLLYSASTLEQILHVSFSLSYEDSLLETQKASTQTEEPPFSYKLWPSFSINVMCFSSVHCAIAMCNYRDISF